VMLHEQWVGVARKVGTSRIVRPAAQQRRDTWRATQLPDNLRTTPLNPAESAAHNRRNVIVAATGVAAGQQCRRSDPRCLAYPLPVARAHYTSVGQLRSYVPLSRWMCGCMPTYPLTVPHVAHSKAIGRTCAARCTSGWFRYALPCETGPPQTAPKCCACACVRACVRTQTQHVRNAGG
jgi:hypothetical protein